MLCDTGPARIDRRSAVVRDFGGRSIEFIPPVTERFTTDAIDVMARMSLEADAPLNWNVLSITQDTIEGRIADILAKKRQLFDEVIAQNGPPPRLGLSEAEIFGLFKIQARPRRAA